MFFSVFYGRQSDALSINFYEIWHLLNTKRYIQLCIFAAFEKKIPNFLRAFHKENYSIYYLKLNHFQY